MYVMVLEVVNRPDLRRVRACVGSPGWISLLNMDTGYRWAEKAEPRSLKRDLASVSQGAPNPAKLFVGQLPYYKSEAELKALFEWYGRVVEIAILRDTYGNSKGCAFVNFAELE